MSESIISFLQGCGPDNAPLGHTEWLHWCEIDLPSGQLSVTDPMLFPGMVVSIRSGKYEVALRLFNSDRQFVVAGVRVRSHGTSSDAGRRLGYVGVDFARLTVGDSVVMGRAGSEIVSTALAEPALRALEADELFGFVPWNIPGTIKTPFVKTPYGDGRFPVYELNLGDQRVGVEVELIDSA